MDVKLSQTPLADVDADVLVLFRFETEAVGDHDWAAVDAGMGGLIARSIELDGLEGKPHELLLLPSTGLKAPRVLVVGAGKRSDLSPGRVRQLAGTAVRSLTKKRGHRLAFGPIWTDDLRGAELVRGLVEGAVLSLYDADVYKSKHEPRRLDELTILGPADDRAQRAAREAQVTTEATNWARGLVNAPGNFLTPADMVERARELASENSLELTVLDRDDLKRIGAGAILGVGQGSDNPPFLVALRHRGGGGTSGRPTLGLIGKGVTFDTGGISIKPAERMHYMKNDMAGAAAAYGAMRAIAQLRPAVDVLAVTPLVENMPSSKAMKPGDVFKALSGKTIEVLNTDAEGRLILADALWYAQSDGATHLVDLATLTGAVNVALGSQAAAIMGRSQPWVDRIVAAATAAGERLWQLPLYPEYKEQLKSDVADMSNTGGRPAGTITAAMFLQEHVPDSVEWAHLDIAATAWNDRARTYQAVGPTGVGVRTLVRLAFDLATTS